MTIDQHFIDLINADIDGEISHADKEELETFLAGNDSAQSLYEELATLCGSLESIEAESPPPHLRHVIMNSVRPTRPKTESPGWLQVLVTTPALRYAATFAVGVILTLSAVSSNQFSNNALDDITGLVGTVSNPDNSELLNSIAIDNVAVAGKVSLRSTGAMLILDFDLVANGPIEIEANYPDRSIWFNGFGQLESSGTTVTAKSGSVTLRMEGKRRFAVYLRNGNERGVTVKLHFMSEGKVVHEASLNYEPAE